MSSSFVSEIIHNWAASALPGGDGNLCQAVEQHGRRQADKGHHRAVQELKLSNQDIGCLGTGGDLLHEVEVDLYDRQKQHVVKNEPLVWNNETSGVIISVMTRTSMSQETKKTKSVDLKLQSRCLATI